MKPAMDRMTRLSLSAFSVTPTGEKAPVSREAFWEVHVVMAVGITFTKLIGKS